jgi:hypothetical protein
MGQYLKGSKIGTCESMYYMRLEEAQKLARMGARDDDGIKFQDYLEDNETRFRFPFPDEDGCDHIILVGKSHEKGFDIPAGIIEVDHSEICVGNEHRGGGHNVNIFLPCIHSEEFKKTGLRLSNGGAGEQYLTVLFQAMREGKEKTIFACPRCGAQQRFGDEDIEKLKAYAMEYFEPYNREGKNAEYGGNQGLYDYAKKVIERIK